MSSYNGSTTLHKRPPTPKSSPQSTKSNGVPPLPESHSNKKESHPPRRSSLNFLRRSRSGDPVRKVPIVAEAPPTLPDIFNGTRGNSASQVPPPSRNGFGREVRDSVATISGKFGTGDMQTLPEPHNGAGRNPLGGYVPGRKSTDSVIDRSTYITSSSVPFTEDPYGASMAHRGRYSYASSAVSSTINSPRRVRRRKDPTPFNILVIGAKSSGKSSFLRFLRQSLAIKPKRGQAPGAEENADAVEDPVQSNHSTAAFKSSYLETEIDGERIGLTLWDSAGLEKNVVDLQLRETVAFLEAKFEETFTEETKVIRAPGVRDTHIHCVFLLLDPARLTPNNHYYGKNGSKGQEVGGLDEDLDMAVLKALQGKTVVIPVISKADNCTTPHMEALKKLVRKGLSKAGVDPLDALDLEIPDSEPESPTNGNPNRGSLAEVDEDRNYEDARDLPEPNKSIKSTASARRQEGNLSFLPMSIISPDSYEPGEPVGRRFPWGFADPYDEGHCDFVKLKEAVFSDWRGDLREKSRDVWYENWRSDRLGASSATGRPSKRR